MIVESVDQYMYRLFYEMSLCFQDGTTFHIQ